MALYIIEEGTVSGMESQWHVGERNPLLQRDEVIYVDDVIEVQADGDELRWILGLSYNLGLPFRHGQVVRFFGDDAKFIVANSLK